MTIGYLQCNSHCPYIKDNLLLMCLFYYADQPDWCDDYK